MCGSCAVYAPVVCTCHVALRLRLVQAQQLGEPLGVDLLVVRRHSPDVVLHDAELQVRFPPARLDERAWVYASCLLYTSPSPRDKRQSRMPSSA